MTYSPPSSLIFWLKADAGVCSDNESPTPTPCANNDRVYLWKDQTSNHSDVLQTTYLQRPVYKTSIINGQPGVLFTNSAAEYMLTAASIAHGIGTGNFLLACVYNTFTTTNGAGGMFSIGSWAPAFYVNAELSPRKLRFYLTSTGVLFSDCVVANDTTYLSLFGRSGSGTYTINAWHAEIGDSPVVSSTSSTDSGSIATNPFLVGYENYEDNHLNGYIHELMLFGPTWVLADKTNVIDYLNYKYANVSPPSSLSEGGAMMMDF